MDNDMIKKKSTNALIDMYGRIKSKKDLEIWDLDEDGDGFEIKGNPRVYKNTMSLKISTEMGINLLKETFP